MDEVGGKKFVSIFFLDDFLIISTLLKERKTKQTKIKNFGTRKNFHKHTMKEAQKRSSSKMCGEHSIHAPNLKRDKKIF